MAGMPMLIPLYFSDILIPDSHGSPLLVRVSTLSEKTVTDRDINTVTHAQLSCGNYFY